MKNRAFAVALAIVAVASFQPGNVRADKFFKPPHKFRPPITGGILTEDTTCPAATHVLSSICFPDRKHTYLVFNRVKGLKRFLGGMVTISGPVDTTSCPLPLVSVEKIGPPVAPPPPCGP